IRNRACPISAQVVGRSRIKSDFGWRVGSGRRWLMRVWLPPPRPPPQAGGGARAPRVQLSRGFETLYLLTCVTSGSRRVGGNDQKRTQGKRTEHQERRESASTEAACQGRLRVAALAVRRHCRSHQAVRLSLHRAQSGRELSRTARFAGELRRRPAADA